MLVGLITFLFVSACALSAPTIVLVLITRNKISRQVGRSLLAASFAAASAYQLWRVEWFDVWRHGTPSLSYVLLGYAPYIGIIAAVGWLLGGVIVPRQRRSAG